MDEGWSIERLFAWLVPVAGLFGGIMVGYSKIRSSLSEARMLAQANQVRLDRHETDIKELRNEIMHDFDRMRATVKDEVSPLRDEIRGMRGVLYQLLNNRVGNGK